ncbi:hypothetical protein [Pseudonocardia sp. H11422]|uniref:hypothetical protein n=1 Tax=Pseudonocardia sp. H11422 TaxID=2835866 RepID=UPI001BDBE713|nr:hypothetical protein [Pseudonocardia sp. H11422]
MNPGVPGGAVDVHAHVMTGAAAGVDGAAYAPFEAPVEDFLAHLGRCGSGSTRCSRPRPTASSGAANWPYVTPPGPVPTPADHRAVLDTWLPGQHLASTCATKCW